MKWNLFFFLTLEIILVFINKHPVIYYLKVNKKV